MSKVLAIRMYHGTNKENADLILEEGFKAGTYFAHGLDNAIEMGGDYVFEVLFYEKPTEYWEYISSEEIGKEKILSLVRHSPFVLFEGKEAARQFKIRGFIKEVWDDGVEICDTCSGQGQMEQYPKFTRLRDGLPTTVCEKCHGHGVNIISGSPEIYDHYIT
jgi:hypothetical protein